MYELCYSPNAVQDLDEIYDYIRNEVKNPAAAQKVVFNILDTIEKLRDFPKMGSSLESITGMESDYRYLVCDSYIAFYRIDDTNVFIDRILYARRDYIRVFFDTRD
jgi:toxin ParE1/3/4